MNGGNGTSTVCLHPVRTQPAAAPDEVATLPRAEESQPKIDFTVVTIHHGAPLCPHCKCRSATSVRSRPTEPTNGVFSSCERIDDLRRESVFLQHRQVKANTMP